MTNRRATTALAAGAAAVTIALTAAAFWLSYEHLHDLANGNGLRGTRAWAWPATVDLFIVTGELLVLRASLRHTVDPWAIALAALGSTGSIALNISGVGRGASALAYVVAAVPPPAALVAFGALMRQVHEVLDRIESAPAAAAQEQPARVVICHGPRGIRLAVPAPRPTPAPAEPAGPVGERIEDVEALFRSVHAPVVYFIQNGNRVKIGTSTNLRRRVARLSLPTRSIILVLHGDVAYERELHARFAAYRTPGTEWFDYAEPLAAFVASGGSAPEEPARSATEAASERSESGTEALPAGSGERHAAALEAPQEAPTERHESAPEAPAGALPGRPGTATEAPAPAPRKRPAKRSKPSDRDAAKAAIEALYEALGCRPTEAEMVAELKRIKTKFTSPAFAKKVRAEIETEQPALAALGTDNVRPLTG